ncbi:ATP-dependent RNA helicase [Blastocystis sp. subtype 4]|uniref:ATP-dependent RNA helicase n=1 Tax=Blastocystis sp. subtype 4 TaxID=944170 RepID=UPI000711C7A8|nr:ATP-dependent RNA helicase [Blastocystis sp. subtype 4]KNB43068.1 ATP-dependent RNA helicase [Blastocystis sp. subtype 4]|eukprot:XP_014526511.1 ATP-dependent RNA helicase [Blastocystis sp. subtype 4]
MKGKTLSLLCGSLAWLHATSSLPDDYVRGELSSATVQDSGLPAWLLDTTDEDAELKEKRERQDYQLKSLREVLEKYKQSKMIAMDPKRMKLTVSSAARIETEQEDEEELLFDTPFTLSVATDEEPISVTKIYYCSRTHSQLAQVLNEFLQSDWSKDTRCSILGGRRSLCVNPSVRRLPTDAQISDQCLFLQRNHSRGKQGCRFHNSEKEQNLRNEILLTNLDIEDLLKTADSTGGCPYYASRRSLPYLQLVLLPYNLILSRSSREALGIDLKNQVVIFDEAHNLFNTLTDIYSPRISLLMFETSLNQLSAYYMRYSDRLSSSSHSFIIHLQTVLKEFISFLQSRPSDLGVVSVLSTDGLLRRLHLEDVNLFDLLRFVVAKRILFKLNGFIDREGVIDFIGALTTDNNDSRIVVSYEEKQAYVQLLLLNPADHFQEIASLCRSVIITGGTLQPFGELEMQLFPKESQERITCLSLPHILPPENILGLILTSRESTHQELKFDYSTRDDPLLLQDLLMKVELLCSIVPGGMAVFFPSFQMMQDFIRYIHTEERFTLLNQQKRVFCESRGKEDIFGSYAKHIRNTGKGALLFAVIGGKLSEGINFSDELGRCVMVVGMPYANKKDVILQERMRFADSQSIGAGSELYRNMCIKAVNQTIGRAFRHKKDWAVVVLADCRYSQPSTLSRITPWIATRCQMIRRAEELKTWLIPFINDKRNG